ncbi:MAG: hypothetical protein A2571_03640 [Candidatus Vogelbacteria bacterium RIFOXYD1_FULL_44_32]|uniref:Uncharacterized protein n=1 Tax=Candidatus Vogelbacteria bacterium RIFOXYD1_FULL_44_32 TaxID=1802438 RepID=A0A1G2QC08_9BACT|nr:MAG: hypothetical protein A2571_03640 [Candidatus Vogelbacteria bacterium RIFOXYD1_FULL_44_32]
MLTKEQLPLAVVLRPKARNMEFPAGVKQSDNGELHFFDPRVECNLAPETVLIIVYGVPIVVAKSDIFEIWRDGEKVWPS